MMGDASFEYKHKVFHIRFTRHFALYLPSHPYIYSSHIRTLTVSLQPTSSLCIALSYPEDVDTERNTHDTGHNQRPGIAPDLRRPDHLVVKQSCA